MILVSLTHLHVMSMLCLHCGDKHRLLRDWQAADGETDKRTPRCKKVLPAGALRIKWPADVDFDEDESFVWTMLNAKSFNKDVHLGWRFAASELKRMEEAEQAQQRGRKKPRKGSQGSL